MTTERGGLILGSVHPDDLAHLAEIANGTATRYEYERGVIDLLGARVGFEVAMFKRASGLGEYTPGLDPSVARECDGHWARFAEEVTPVAAVARKQRGVAVDLDVFGIRRMERFSFYQRLMRPHRGTSTALIFLAQRGVPLATLALGRVGRGFTARELDVLRRLAPTLALCEASAVPPRRDGDAASTMESLLTLREREVLAHLRLGHTNAQIGLALGSSPRTVRNQLSSIYRKLGVGSRAEAVGVELAAWRGPAPQ